MDNGDRLAFIERYGGLYENSPWVAARTWDRLGAAPDRSALAAALAETVDAASESEKLALVRAHPDLAGRAAVRGELTADSSDEQRSAGLDQCSPDEYRRFERLNAAYRSKFGFPFVMAVRDSSRRAILDAFESRLEHDRDRELDTAIAEIHRIAKLRLDAQDDD
ncbi:MAG: 2-oxo-4-hydroxy-4-carboxy-5-ureidoimidazoline decarboxylase [Woeseiaceae bacterium]|nr:2-oxo-4-hydroxy-4-carboxy-5-ureidoimidazoline decarboxylase [Woeseiaceae bacterium]